MNKNDTNQQQRAARLRQIRMKRGFKSMRAASDRFGWEANAYKHHENGTRAYSIDDAAEYGKAFGVSPGWLTFGNADNPSQAVENTYSSRDQVVPVLSWLAFATSTNVRRVMSKASVKITIPRSNELSSLVFTLDMQGDSMLEKPVIEGESFPHQTQLFFDPEEPWKPGDFVLVKLDADDSALFRKIKVVGQSPEGKTVADLVPLNSAYDTKRVVIGENAHIIARLQKSLKSH